MATSTSLNSGVLYPTDPDPTFLSRRGRVSDPGAAPSLPYWMVEGYRSLRVKGDFNHPRRSSMGSGKERFNRANFIVPPTRVTRDSKSDAHVTTPPKKDNIIPEFALFLNLPFELRRQILSYVVAPEKNHSRCRPARIDFRHPAIHHTHPNTPGIFRVNKQLHSEATEVHRKQEVHVHINHDYTWNKMDWSSSFPLMGVFEASAIRPASIKHLHVHLYVGRDEISPPPPSYKAQHQPSHNIKWGLRTLTRWLNGGIKPTKESEILTLRVSLYEDSRCAWASYSMELQMKLLDEFKILRARRVEAGNLLVRDVPSTSNEPKSNDPILRDPFASSDRFEVKYLKTLEHKGDPSVWAGKEED